MRLRILLVCCAALALTVGVATATGGNGTQTFQFKATYQDPFTPTITWNCSGVRQIKKDGTIADSETCIATNVPANTFVAGTYTSNATLNVNLFVFGSSDPNSPVYGGDACAIVAPGIPGESQDPLGPITTTFTYVQSDFDAFPRCALSFTYKFADQGGGVWKTTLNIRYRP